jgi:ATP-dependent protease ClpP protease subunit
MTGHIFIEGEVGVQVTAKTVREDINAYPHATEFIVHFNSPGGDVYEGYHIGSILANIGKPTTAHIGAMCASIATYAALCCDRVVMNPAGDFMIHLPTGTLSGNAEDLRRGAEQLERIKSELIDRYMQKVARKGVTREQLEVMMENETSMGPGEALAMGFVDEVREKLKAVARFDINTLEQMKQEDVKGALETLGAKLDAFINSFKIKNMIELTLADGTMIMSTAETLEAIVGSQLTDEQGEPLQAGEVELADGQVITVGENGLVQSVKPKTEANADPKDDVAALKAEIESLKKQLEEAGKNASAAKEEAKVAAQNLSKLAIEAKNLKTSLDEIKNSTFGDKEVPADAPDKKEEKPIDPMLARMRDIYFNAYKTSR